MISERLKAERESLGLSQQALADRVGVSLRSQQNYESGDRIPDATYLGAMAEAGADVLFILTGQRGQPVPQLTKLPPRVRALVDNYEHTDEAGKKIIEAAASAAAKPVSRKRVA